MSRTVTESVVVPVPPLLVAVTVWTVVACSAVGVPESAQVDVLNASPAGSAGLIAQLTIAPAVEFAFSAVMAVSFVNASAEGE